MRTGAARGQAGHFHEAGFYASDTEFRALIVPFVVLGSTVAVATFVMTAESGRLHEPADLSLADLRDTNLSDADFSVLSAGLPPNVIVERFRDDFTFVLQRCRVSVSQAGYNTVLELLITKTRAVLVPFDAGRETEQRTRAERLVALGMMELVTTNNLTPQSLAAAIERAIGRGPPSLSIDAAGARNSAEIIAQIISNRAAGSLSRTTAGL